MRNINRRESPRIEIKLRCHVTSPALWMRSAMYTENISRSGLLVAWRGEGSALPMPSIGQIITVEVELPANHGFGQKCIHCQGTVIRDFPQTRNARGSPCGSTIWIFVLSTTGCALMDAMQPVVNSWMA